MEKTRESQYERCLEVQREIGRTALGLMTNHAWHDDPKRLTFLFSRYKFVAKMFSGFSRVLEVGCADAFATRIVRQEVPHVTAVDFDPIFVEDARRRMDERWSFDIHEHDMLSGPVSGGFDGVYAMDVIEHIPAEQEDLFVSNMFYSLKENGVMILGMPSIHSQLHASIASKLGHVNCKDAEGLKSLMQKFFHNVFIFSMNDEVVHTGFYPMAQYLLAIGCNSKITNS